MLFPRRSGRTLRRPCPSPSPSHRHLCLSLFPVTCHPSHRRPLCSFHPFVSVDRQCNQRASWTRWTLIESSGKPWTPWMRLPSLTTGTLPRPQPYGGINHTDIKQAIVPSETSRLSRQSRVHGVPPAKILSRIVQKLAFVELNRLPLCLATVLGFVRRKRWVECLRLLQVFYRSRHKHYFLGFAALILHEHTTVAFNQPTNASVQAATTGHI